jgi:hypothetical protein
MANKQIKPLNYRVEVTAMQKHITDRSSMGETFSDFKKANEHFLKCCDFLNCDPGKPIGKNKEREAGGIGHDYRIELLAEV